jgi:hypothetical protein
MKNNRQNIGTAITLALALTLASGCRHAVGPGQTGGFYPSWQDTYSVERSEDVRPYGQPEQEMAEPSENTRQALAYSPVVVYRPWLLFSTGFGRPYGYYHRRPGFHRPAGYHRGRPGYHRHHR